MDATSVVVGEPTTLSNDAFEFVRTLIHQQAAIVLEPTKAYLVEARLRSLARKAGDSSVDAFLRRARAQRTGPVHQEIVEAMTTNETLFFRDAPAFEALRVEIVPDLIKRRQDRRTLNIWSAASSSGQEPYSVAMILRECFPELHDWDIRMFGTDISRDVLDAAKRGEFSQIEVNRGLPATLLVKYFRHVGTRWVIREDIREMVTFLPCNLAAEWPALPQFDLILLRNVLIYFDLDTKRSILAKVARSMARDGTLLLGNGETTMNLDSGFERMTYDKAVYYKPKRLE